MGQQTLKWDGQAFITQWVAKIEEGITCVKEDDAAQRALPNANQEKAYSQEELAEVVVMFISVVHNSAIRMGLDPLVYAKALDNRRKRSVVLHELNTMIEQIVSGPRN